MYILNLALKDRESKDSLKAAKYIVDENCGLLNVYYYIKISSGNESDNFNYYTKVISL